ncbi:hypothetical protein D0Y65_053249 [Glycine soja]|uniref:Uncharacterized protein n=1 Tax=Glycine soja TaxID=3848 RepID=A0A445F177_GLYSO|nr:hypothetical protein D0Y65_053249 [Glycine soja]
MEMAVKFLEDLEGISIHPDREDKWIWKEDASGVYTAGSGGTRSLCQPKLMKIRMITVVNPALDEALEILQKFAVDVYNGKVSEDRLRFGAPWRHPPQIDDPKLRMEWAKLQLMDFVQSLANTEFGVNYRIDYSEEIFDDPSTFALLQVGLLYAQRDPPFLRPISKGIQRCLACTAVDAAEFSQLDSFCVAQNDTRTLLSPFDGTKSMKVGEVHLKATYRILQYLREYNTDVDYAARSSAEAESSYGTRETMLVYQVEVDGYHGKVALESIVSERQCRLIKYVDCWMMDDRDRVDDNIGCLTQYSYLLYWSSNLL